ncbi:MAG: nascent polypeptide-associated complex protein [Fervidicoccaceae archaeon]
MLGVSPRDLRRAMRRLGINVEVDQVEDAERVIVERSSGKALVVERPAVAVLKMQGQTVIYVTGEVREVEQPKAEEVPEVREEDVQLVANEAGVSLEEARAALESTGGDIARAIILLESRKRDLGRNVNE